MPLQSGDRLGTYQIRGPLGAGGMGEVYRAHDTSLGRDVAVKILPPSLAGDPERLARFEREARLLASLNHPNIATLFGFERGEAIPYLVMEVVEGETLAQCLKRGALPRDEMLETFRQIAEGLEAAHESGVIHRDLKPGNIMITPAGKVKLLDFGLAKAMEGDGGVASDASMSPTLTAAATQRGEVMGTAYYMSPEQARGKPVDRRTDIWAFGCVMYECITGRMAFGGETISDTIALILQREPDLAALPSDLPPRITELLRRCFEKDARRRLRDIGEARLEIEKVLAGNLAPTLASGAVPMAGGGPGSGPVAAAARGRFSAGVVAAALAAGLAAGAAGWALLSPRGGGGPAGPAAPVRFVVDPPPGFDMGPPMITRDGRVMVFPGREQEAASAETRRSFLFRRDLDSLESVRLEPTEGVVDHTLSPDGRWVAFVSPTSPGAATYVLRKMPLDGSAPPLTLAAWDDGWAEGLLWLIDARLIVLTRDLKLVRVAADGSGASAPETLRVDAALRDLGVRGALPAPDRILVGSSSWAGRGYHQEAHVLDLRSGEVQRILDDATSPRWSETGHIVFTRDDTLFGVAVDPATFQPRGAPVALMDGLGTESADSGAIIFLSSSGSLVHRPGGRWGVHRRLVFVDEAGGVTPWSGDRLSFQDIAASPDGSKLAATIMGDDLLFSVWVSDTERPRLRQIARELGLDCNTPRWMPDNETVVYSCNGNARERAGIYRLRADGSGTREMILQPDESGLVPRFADAASPDGRWLLLRDGFPSTPATRLSLVDLASPRPAESVRPLAADLQAAWDGSFSPDGRLVAYLTRTSGRLELHARSFDDDGAVGPPVVAADGDLTEAFWHPGSGAGEQVLVYGDRRARHFAMRVRVQPVPAVGDPVPVMDHSGLRPRISEHDMLRDGRLLGIQRGEDEDAPHGAVVVLNWHEELSRQMAASR